MWLVLLAGTPATVVAVVLIWRAGLAPEIRWTLALAIGGTWVIAAASARRIVTQSLQVVANLLAALREGDYSIRGLAAPGGSAMGMVMREVNDLGTTLQRQRAEALESAAVLTHVMEEIAVAVFAFDPEGRLLLVNRAGEVLVGRKAGSLIGEPAAAIGFETFLAGDGRRLVDRAFGGRVGRFEVRRAVFYRHGRPHHLIVVADLSQALREEQQAAWQRIVRVLSHEINNSLTPVKSIAHSLGRMVERAPAFPQRADVRQGLSLIEERSGALSRFLRSYAQLARLPRPNPVRVDVGPLLRRVIELEERLPVRLHPSSDLVVDADPDQLEQLLINLVRNAVDASLETGGGVSVGWVRSGQWLELTIEDEGFGVPDSANLFVPFFTTKPNGSGIGLALGRQIAEAHGGTITLDNRPDQRGCRATLRLPI